MFEMSLTSSGLNEAQDFLHELQKLTGKVELGGIARANSDVTNAEILEWLAEHGKDYTSLSSTDMGAISDAYTAEFDKQILASQISGGDMAEMKKKSMHAAMKKLGEIVADKVEEGGSVKTGQLVDNLRSESQIKTR